MNSKKQKYNMAQSVWFMIGYAWRYGKATLFATVGIAVLSVLVSLTQLYVAPAILQKVETAAPLMELLGTIGGFTGLLFLLMGLKEYVNQSTFASRIFIRGSIATDCTMKYCTTAYPNVLDPEKQKLRSQAVDMVLGGNNQAGEYIWEVLAELLTNIFGFIIYLFLLRNLDPVLLVVVLVTAVLSFVASRRASQWGYGHRDEWIREESKLDYLRNRSESAAAAKDIRLFGLQDWLTETWYKALKSYDMFFRRLAKKELLAGLADAVLSLLRNGIAYVYLIHMALTQGMPASEFLLYFTAVTGFTAWITGILQKFLTLHHNCQDLSMVQEYLNMPEPFKFEGGVPIPAKPAEGYQLTLENVDFRYPGAEEDTIHGMNLTIHPGEKLAIVGLNGAGKTTLIKLLCGFLDPTHGRVLLNGMDVREFNRREYYELFSAVFQDFSVLDVTVAENVAQREENIDRQRVEKCLELAGLTKAVSALPKGLDTVVGRNIYLDGTLFSGGETQRLMLARALYKDGPVLVLDEPTAALDPLAESDIYQKYNEMTEGKTSVFISHRLASTRFCNRIIFLDHGTIREEGTHEELLKLGGGYAELFEIQSRYYREGRDF